MYVQQTKHNTVARIFNEACHTTCALYVNSLHYTDVILSVMASQITGVSIVCFTVCSGADQRKTQTLHVTGLCEGNLPVTYGFPSQRPSDAKMFPLDDVIMFLGKAILHESVHEFHILVKSFSLLCIYNIHLCIFIANERWPSWFEDTYVGDLVPTR